MSRVLLIASTTGYQVHSFTAAAARLQIDLILATDRCHVLENPWGDNAIAIAADGLEALATQAPFDGIKSQLAINPRSSPPRQPERLGLRFSPLLTPSPQRKTNFSAARNFATPDCWCPPSN